MERGFPPPQPTRGSGERRKLPQQGLGPKLNFIQFGCQRSHLVTRIALNFHSKQRLLLLRKTVPVRNVG